MEQKWHHSPHAGPPSYFHEQSRASSEDPPTYRACRPPPEYREHEGGSGPGVSLRAFPQGSAILIIGAYTRQGMHIIDRLLEHHYTIRGIVSSQSEAAQTSKHFEARHGRERYQPCVVSDPTVDGAFDSAAKTCSGVIFVTNRSKPVTASGVETLARVMSILGSAMKEADMHRFVYCCPAAAAVTGDFGQRLAVSAVSPPQVGITPPSPPSYESLRNGFEQSRPDTVPFSVELAIRDWIGSNQPDFALDVGKYPMPPLSIFHALRC